MCTYNRRRRRRPSDAGLRDKRNCEFLPVDAAITISVSTNGRVHRHSIIHSVLIVGLQRSRSILFSGFCTFFMPTFLCKLFNCFKCTSKWRADYCACHNIGYFWNTFNCESVFFSVKTHVLKENQMFISSV